MTTTITIVLTDHGEQYRALGKECRYEAHQYGLPTRTGEGQSYWQAIEQLALMKQVLHEGHMLWVS